MMKDIVFLCCLTAVFYLAACERGCPPPEEIAPCTCQEVVYVDLQCENISEPEVIVKVFEKAERYHFNKFTLKNSVLQYIPHAIFDDVEVVYMDFDRVSFVNTFDELPRNPGVKKISLEKVRIMGGWDWKKLSVFTQLEDLSITDVPMKRLATDFRPNITKKLKVLRLSWCQIKKFRDDEFKDFVDLQIFNANHDDITVIKRSMFARPSNLKQIAFEYNRISSIPEDMFTDMPNLHYVGFGNNLISLLEEKTFLHVIDQLEYFRFQDNPIKCDCRIQWITWHKPKYFYGKCEQPKALHGKNLPDLKPDDFRC